jgi:hypothetical protein
MKLAIICGGRDAVEQTDTPLQFIENSLEKVKETLELNNWICKPLRINTLEEYNTWLDNICKSEQVEEFLFYYTGHGVYGNSTSQVGFQLCFKGQKATIAQLIDETMKVFPTKEKEPQKIGFVIDSCYSGDAITERYNDEKFEILTSSDSSKSYEKTGLYKDNPDYGISVFSYYFCTIFNEVEQNDAITLEDISGFVNDSQKKQNSLHSKALKRDKIIIGHNKEINEIKTTLKNNFSTKQFKDKIFEFLDKDNLGFKEALVAEDFDALLRILMKYKKEVLYCICQELGFSNSYIDAFKTDKCANFKEKAQNNREVKKVILRIHQSSSGSTDNCLVEGWLQLNIDVTEPLEKLNIDFSSDYISVLSDYIAKALQDKFLAKSPLDLDLILDDGLFRYDFYPLVEKNMLMITTQFLSRNKNFFSSKVSTVWKNNSELFEEKQLEPIEKNIYPIDEVYEKGDIMYCFTDDKIVVNSSHNLLTTQYLEMIKKLGLPFVISPCSDIPTKVNFKWGNATMNKLKSKVIMALSRHYKQVNSLEKNIQFIYDNYHDVAKFKEIINETDEKIKG